MNSDFTCLSNWMHFCQCPIMPHGLLTSVYVSVPHLLTPFISLSNTRIQDNTKNMNMSRENVAVQYEAPVWSQNSISTNCKIRLFESEVKTGFSFFAAAPLKPEITACENSLRHNIIQSIVVYICVWVCCTRGTSGPLFGLDIHVGGEAGKAFAHLQQFLLQAIVIFVIA